VLDLVNGSRFGTKTDLIYVSLDIYGFVTIGIELDPVTKSSRSGILTDFINLMG
jgi:hypothetical protein